MVHSAPTDPSPEELFRSELASLAASAPRARDLIGFHARNKFIVRAHDEGRYRALGRIVARSGSDPMASVLSRYQQTSEEALRGPATIGRHTDVLQHLAGMVRDVLSAEQRGALAAAIDRYRTGRTERQDVVDLFRELIPLGHRLCTQGYLRARHPSP